jgi:hypothetical protein
MKAMVADAEWAPRRNYKITQEEIRRKRVNVGSQAWRAPLFEIKEAPTPEMNHHDVMIRIKKCGICGSDTHLYETDAEGYIIYSGPVKFPTIIGHEYSGIVEKVGSEVSNFKVGDKVAAESIIWCGTCASCRTGAFNQCERVELAGITAPGGFAEFIVTNERQCWNINELSEIHEDDALFDIGALLEPAGCAYCGLFVNGGGFQPGAVVTVFGLGPIGLAAVALARTAGASKIMAFDKIQERLDLAMKMGADLAFNITGTDISPGDRILEITKGRGADVQVEAAGAANLTIPEMERSLALNGKIIYLGRADTRTSMYLDILVSGANKIIGSRGHAGHGIYGNIIRLVKAGRLDLRKMITSYFNFNDLQAALKKSSQRQDGKIMIKIS